MPKLTQSRAFLVQLSDETDPKGKALTGRVEHIESGLRGRFSSREELWAFIERVLTEQAGRDSANHPDKAAPAANRR